MLNKKEALDRFKDRQDIKLIEYDKWTTNAKFFDLVVGKHFFAKPDNVYNQKSKHPERSGLVTITKEMAVEKFKTHHPEVQIVVFNGWNEKSTFFDVIANDKFDALPTNVFKRKTIHPSRRKRKIQQHDETSTKETLIYRTDLELIEFNGWGSKCKFRVKDTGEIWFVTPASLHLTKALPPQKSKEKIKETKLKNGSIIGFQKAIEKINRTDIAIVEETWQGWTRRCTFKVLATGEEYIARPDQVFYSKSNSPQTAVNLKTKYFISDTGQGLSSWLREQTCLKPSYSSIQGMLLEENKDGILLSELEVILKNYKEHKTKLEAFSESLFETSHFNKIVAQVNQKQYRPDFKINETTFVNVDGLYWHSEEQKTPSYHFDMRNNFEIAGLRILQFYENEVYEKTEIVKSITSNAKGITSNKIFGRKCAIRIIEQKDANLFLNLNHLMGTVKAKHIGLFYNDILVSVLSYKVKQGKCKIERYCSLINSIVIGGFTKLLKKLESVVDVDEIHYWTDLRYGTGFHLKNYGFEHIKDTQGWKWTDNHQTFNRLACRANMDERNLSEREHAKELKWKKIYDAGQRLYIKSKK